jgi:hypothetical protein
MAVFVSAETDFYTSAWLREAARRHGVPLAAEQDDATAFWVTVSDVEDLANLRRVKAIAKGRPVVVGGLEATTGNGAVMAFADIVVAGEGEEFVAAWGAGGLDAASALSCVATKADPWRAVVPSTLVDFSTAPVVQATKSCWYMLAARGCPQHCNFCFTSWATKCQQAPLPVLQRAVNSLHRADPKAALTYITNYSQGLPGRKRGAQSFLVKDFLAKPDETKGLTMIRLGVEGTSEQRRAWFHKPIPDDDLRSAIALARDRHLQAELFFIVGFADDQENWEHFCETCLPVEGRTGCHLWCKWTYFNPCPLTPLWRYDVTGLTAFDPKPAFRQAMARTQRFHDHPIQKLTKALWRTVWHRVLWEHADAVPKTAPMKQEPDEFIADMQARGLGYTLAPSPTDRLPGEQVVMSTEAARKHRAIEAGVESMPPHRQP